jgi:ferredoxin-like protein FixX
MATIVRNFRKVTSTKSLNELNNLNEKLKKLASTCQQVYWTSKKFKLWIDKDFSFKIKAQAIELYLQCHATKYIKLQKCQKSIYTSIYEHTNNWIIDEVKSNNLQICNSKTQIWHVKNPNYSWNPKSYHTHHVHYICDETKNRHQINKKIDWYQIMLKMIENVPKSCLHVQNLKQFAFNHYLCLGSSRSNILCHNYNQHQHWIYLIHNHA